MEYIRKPCPSNSNFLKKQNVTLLWCDDGWCYIPALKLRQKFTETKYFHEKWDGVIATPLYIEDITWTLFSEKPRAWSETSDQFSEFYQTKGSI
jgi:hypothetical protein